MKFRILGGVAVSGAMMLCGGPALAWHSQGHMMTAEIAWKAMTPGARCRAVTLLRSNPIYAELQSTAKTTPPDQALFVGAANWPDAIKSKTSGYTNDGDEAEAAGAINPSANIGSNDKVMHKYWHFIDNPIPDDKGYPLAPKVNAAERVTLFATALGSSASSDDLKAYDLAWIIHLVGDLHQPLHTASQYDPLFKTAPHKDNGGNSVKLHCCGSNLHTFWDAAPGDGDDLDVAVAAADALPAPDATLAGKTDPMDWVSESLGYAKTLAYVTPIGKGPGPFDLTQQYKDDATSRSNLQVALGGVRLGNLLNATLAWPSADCDAPH